MTVLEVFGGGVSDAAFRAFYALESAGGDYQEGIKGLAGILGWSERKTGRILAELVEANIIRVERRYKAPARIVVCGGSAEDLEDLRDRSVSSDGQKEAAEPALDKRSDKIGGSVLTDPDSTVHTELNSQSEAFDRANLSDLGDQILETDPADDLRTRLEALAFRGVSWALRTFEPSVLENTVATVEALARDGIAYNPGGLVNAALRGKVLLFRPDPSRNAARATQSDGDGRSPDVPTVDPERVREAEEQREHYAQYWQDYQAKRDRYPADHNNGQIVPDTYARHQDQVPEVLADPVVGIGKLREGLDQAKRVA